METLLYTPAASRETNAIPVGWLYPAPYAVSMSSLGYLSLFRQLDERGDVVPTRLNSDNLQGFQGSDFELIGISFAFELDILEILKQFEQLGLPFLAKDRPLGQYPLIFSGGPVPTTNPEPYADFFDFFIIGDGEDALNNIVQAYQAKRSDLAKTDKDVLLLTLAQAVPGLYAPSLYNVSYHSDDGPIASIEARVDGAPMQISRQSLSFEAATVVTTPILTQDTVFSDKFLIEVMRGCAHRCRFCLASYATLPAKGPQASALLNAVDEGLKHTKKLGLLGALVADHPDFEALCERLLTLPDVEASMASLRADTVTPLIAKTVKHTRQNSVTLAIESGSERVRKRINKHLRTEHIHRAAEELVSAGIPTLKLYFIAGLPEEGQAEMDESIALIQDLKRQHPKLKLNIGCSTFVPKAQTPFQWLERSSTKQLAERQEQFRKGIYKIADFRPSSAKWDTFQAILSRGDRRLLPFILEFAKAGANLGAMNRALKQIKDQHGGRLPFPELEWYGNRERPADEILAWDLLFLGVSKENLYKEAYWNSNPPL